MPSHDRVGTRRTTTAVVSVYFADAPVALRTQLALGPERTVGVARAIAGRHPELECVVVSTCNRTELVLAAERDITADRVIDLFHEGLVISADGAAAPCLAATAFATVHLGRAAHRHLFRVACGLESQVLGDNEILGQLRRAWLGAEAAGCAGPRLRPLFRDAFTVGKRARSRTDIGSGGAGVGTAVLAAIGERDGQVVIVGAGDAGRTIARRLAKQDRPITIVNRTLGRAVAVATEIGGRALALDALDDALVDADIVVSAVSADARLLTRSRLLGIRDRVPEWTPLLLDVAATPSVDAVDGLELIDFEQLQRHSADVASRRTAAVGDVEALIDQALRRRRPNPHTHRPARHRHPMDKEQRRARTDR